MTKKLMLGIFLAAFLLLANLAFSGEKSSPAPAIAKMAAVPSDCDCFKTDEAPPSPGVRADALFGPDLIKSCPRPWCKWVWIPGHGQRCVCYNYPWQY